MEGFLMYSKTTINELKAMMPRYLEEHGLPTRGAFRCLDPDHEDVHPSMSFYRKNNTCRCFACGVVYDLIDLIRMEYGCNFPKAVQIGCELYGIKEDKG